MAVRYEQTRMHSSRMRTGHSLTVCRSLLLGGGVCSGGGGIPACTEADPPVNRMTDTSKNITLATTSLRPVIISLKLDSTYKLYWENKSLRSLEPVRLKTKSTLCFTLAFYTLCFTITQGKRKNGLGFYTKHHLPPHPPTNPVPYNEQSIKHTRHRSAGIWHSSIWWPHRSLNQPNFWRSL